MLLKVEYRRKYSFDKSTNTYLSHEKIKNVPSLSEAMNTKLYILDINLLINIYSYMESNV